MRSSQTQSEETPEESETLQRRFFSGPSTIGRLFSSRATPLASMPRNWGQRAGSCPQRGVTQKSPAIQALIDRRSIQMVPENERPKREYSFVRQSVRRTSKFHVAIAPDGTFPGSLNYKRRATRLTPDS